MSAWLLQASEWDETVTPQGGFAQNVDLGVRIYVGRELEPGWLEALRSLQAFVLESSSRRLLVQLS